MSDIYDEILNASNIQNILEHYNLKIHNNKCLCPFHSDSHPSMNIHPNKNIAKCFSCGAGGNAISFIQKYENEINHNPINIQQAMQKAIDIQGLNITIPQNNAKERLSKEQLEKQKLNNILKDAIYISESNIIANNIECKNALEYLKNRNLSLETIKSFHIGFNPSFNLVSNELLKKYNLSDLIDVGLIKDTKNNYVDVFNNRITIPIFDANGNTVGFGARALDNITKPKYLNTKETKLFDKSNLLFNFHKAKFYARNNEIIIVEGYMDVISSKELKFDNVVGIMGTAISKEHIKMLKKLNCEITLCLDNDEAGKNAMIRIIPELLKEKLDVNVLDISQLGNYKDFGDLQMAKIPKEKIYQTRISAFNFLMKYKYTQNNELSVENIYKIHKQMWNDGLIANSKDILHFKEYVSKNSNYSNDEIENIINPQKIEIQSNRVDRYKDLFFYYYIIGLIKNYAKKNNDNILLNYVELGKITKNELLESIDSSEFLKDNEVTINIGNYINNYIFKSDNYISFKNDKTLIFENLLNNVKSFDSNGNIVSIVLNNKQKELVIKQYNESFDDSIKAYIENNRDEFEELFIANSNSQFEKLFPKSYKEAFKEQSVSRFKNEGFMEAIRYALSYSEEMKSVMSRQFVNNDKYKSLLVFNNIKNILELTTDNIKSNEKVNNEEKKEVSTDKEIVKEESKSNNPMSILIKLTGKEKETTRGMYLPTENGKAIYIPKQLYNKTNNEMQLLTQRHSQANMSEYLLDTENHVKKWLSQLTIDDFYNKYMNMYKVKMEKEVMV